MQHIRCSGLLVYTAVPVGNTRAVEQVVKPNEQIEFPIEICGPAGQQTWRGRSFRNDDPRTLAFHPPQEDFHNPELHMGQKARLLSNR